MSEPLAQIFHNLLRALSGFRTLSELFSLTYRGGFFHPLNALGILPSRVLNHSWFDLRSITTRSLPFMSFFAFSGFSLLFVAALLVLRLLYDPFRYQMIFKVFLEKVVKRKS